MLFYLVNVVNIQNTHLSKPILILYQNLYETYQKYIQYMHSLWNNKNSINTYVVRWPRTGWSQWNIQTLHVEGRSQLTGPGRGILLVFIFLYVGFGRFRTFLYTKWTYPSIGSRMLQRKYVMGSSTDNHQYVHHFWNCFQRLLQEIHTMQRRIDERHIKMPQEVKT